MKQCQFCGKETRVSICMYGSNTNLDVCDKCNKLIRSYWVKYQLHEFSNNIIPTNKLLQILANNKYKFYRGWTYCNMLGIAFLVGKEISEYFPQFSWIIFAILGGLGVLIIGTIDTKIGMFENEQRFIVKQNKELRKMIGDVMEEKLRSNTK